MDIEAFRNFCHGLLQERGVHTRVNDLQGDVRMDIPKTKPLQVFVCNRVYWWIEQLEPWGSYRIVRNSSIYSNLNDLRKAFNSYFPLNIKMSSDQVSNLCRETLRSWNVTARFVSNPIGTNTMIYIPSTTPQQIFVCNPTYWWIEIQTDHAGNYRRDDPIEYNSKEQLVEALHQYFGSVIPERQFTSSEAQLWMAIDKLADVVHSRL